MQQRSSFDELENYIGTSTDVTLEIAENSFTD